MADNSGMDECRTTDDGRRRWCGRHYLIQRMPVEATVFVWVAISRELQSLPRYVTQTSCGEEVRRVEVRRHEVELYLSRPQWRWWVSTPRDETPCCWVRFSFPTARWTKAKQSNNKQNSPTATSLLNPTILLVYCRIYQITNISSIPSHSMMNDDHTEEAIKEDYTSTTKLMVWWWFPFTLNAS